ncbi:phage integrase family protein [Paraburkholderia aspalathi]|nr:phage integrase family protein [Paraburkholderia aspalathi]
MNTVLNLQDELNGPFDRVGQHTFRIVWNHAKLEVALGDEDAIVPTVLRHTCASRLVLSGIDMRLIQKFLGHRSYKSMLRYEELTDWTNFDACVPAIEVFTDY